MRATRLRHQRFLLLQRTLRIPPTRPPGPLSPLTPRGSPLQHLRSLAPPQRRLRARRPDGETPRSPSCLPSEVPTLEKPGGVSVTRWRTPGGAPPIWPVVARSSIWPGPKNQRPASHRTSPTLTRRRSCSRGFSSCRSNRKEASTRPASRVPLLTPPLCLRSGSGPGYFPLGQIQLTVRHSSQRNKLVVVVHSCRNLIAFTDHGSDPYVRLYLLPDKRRSGRRKTHTLKRNLNPVYDQT